MKSKLTTLLKTYEENKMADDRKSFGSTNTPTNLIKDESLRYVSYLVDQTGTNIATEVNFMVEASSLYDGTYFPVDPSWADSEYLNFELPEGSLNNLLSRNDIRAILEVHRDEFNETFSVITSYTEPRLFARSCTKEKGSGLIDFTVKVYVDADFVFSLAYAKNLFMSEDDFIGHFEWVMFAYAYLEAVADYRYLDFLMTLMKAAIIVKMEQKHMDTNDHVAIILNFVGLAYTYFIQRFDEIGEYVKNKNMINDMIQKILVRR